MRSLLITALLTAATSAGAAENCAGLPRLSAVTPTGFCVGIIAEGIKSPRAVQALPGGDLLVADMGGGKVTAGVSGGFAKRRLATTKSSFSRDSTALTASCSVPTAASTSASSSALYVSTPRTRRPDWTMSSAVAPKSAPLPGLGRHLLTSFMFDRERNLIVNIGSASDHCESSEGRAPDPRSPCAEGEGKTPQGAIRKYAMRWPAGTPLRWENLATGLRNSMAMAVDYRDGTLWQGENARDAIGAAMPSAEERQRTAPR